MDIVAQPLTKVIDKLEQAKVKYTVTITKPSRNVFPLEDELYVVRQQLDADGILNLMAASNMGKEVSK